MSDSPSLQLRAANLGDLSALVRLENRSFDSDRLSERSFRRLIQKGQATFLVADIGSQLAGYVLVLYHRATSMARMYSLAVDESLRGRGVASALIAASEAEALAHGVVSMRLEVRSDNFGAQRLYERLGYTPFAIQTDYYEDHMDAVRMQKELAPHLSVEASHIPFYAQTLEFTCGPASLMMAMKALDSSLSLDRMLELRLWREATTIFMTSGHGGCGPYGLALSAHARGFVVEIFVSHELEMFVESVRSPEKREVIRIVHEDFAQEIAAAGIPVATIDLPLDEMELRMHVGAIPIVLISNYALTGDKSPHWVVVTGIDARFVYINQPYVEQEETETTCIGIPIARGEFERMRRYGRSRQFATLLISRSAA